MIFNADYDCVDDDDNDGNSADDDVDSDDRDDCVIHSDTTQWSDLVRFDLHMEMLENELQIFSTNKKNY